MIGEFPQLTALASKFPGLYNWSMKQGIFSKPLKKILNMAEKRELPALHPFTLREWAGKRETKETGRRVYFFCDEFTNYNDVEIGIKCIELLERLGYEVLLPKHIESGRTHLSKGLVKRAKEIAIKNVQMLRPILEDAYPVIGSFVFFNDSSCTR